MGYTSQAIKGISWAGGLEMSMNTLTVVRVYAIAHLINPSQYGVFGIVTLIMALVDIATETGINFFLVQEDKNVAVYADTAWIIAMLRGGVIALCIIFLSPFVANFFNTPSLISLLLLGSVVPLIKGFINPFIINFQKDLRFDKDFKFRLSIFSIESASVIIFTFFHRSVESLLWGMIVGAVVEVLLSFLVVKPWPKISFEKAHFHMIVGRGKWVTLAGIFNYLFHNADNIVVGKVLGTTSLGLYDMAYNFSMLPITAIADVISKVTFPVYVKIAGEKARLFVAFVKTSLGIAALVIPFGLLLFFFPREIIGIVLGSKWLAAAPVLQVLAVFGTVRALSISSFTLFYGVKKQKYVSSVTFINFVILAMTILPFIHMYGLIGAGVSAVVSSIGVLPLVGYFLYRVFRA